VLTHPRSEQLIASLKHTFGPHWEISVAGTNLAIEHRDRGTPYRPPRKTPSWVELLDGLTQGFSSQGIARDQCLPLRWGRDTELTISAVQALDPLLKDGRNVTHRRGFIPQPVVRLNARRELSGYLTPGRLTSFINASAVVPITTVDQYATTFDAWLSVLSHLGLHARHVSLYGDISVWQRREVEGITLRFRHLDRTIGDQVLLWNAANPTKMAIDLGTGLEQLAWCCTDKAWDDLIFGDLTEAAPPTLLDAVRTATLLIGSGIHPASRGPGSITRRALAPLRKRGIGLGVSAAVRQFDQFWRRVTPLATPWPSIVSVLENECARLREQPVQEQGPPA